MIIPYPKKRKKTTIKEWLLNENLKKNNDHESPQSIKTEGQKI